MAFLVLGDGDAEASQLFELYALGHHYHPAVSTLCKDIERKWGKHEAKLSMEEYTSHTYRELFELDSQRKVKKTPLCFQKPKGLSCKGDMLEGIFCAGLS